MKAICFREHGGPEVLSYEELPDPQAGPGQVLIKMEAIGLNYIDTYHREGLYPVDLPCTPGVEGAGEVAALGEGVSGVSVGDKVAYAGAMGSYAELAAVPADRLVPLPAGVSTEIGAAAMLQGMTAHYLSHGSYALKGGDTALIHAGAGGVGLLLIQMAKMRGARVLTTVSTEEKEALACGAGADEVIRYNELNFADEVMRLTENRGVDVVYDSVGKSTFDQGLDVLRPLGYMVLFGQSSGPVPPFDPGILNTKGSLFLTRPTMAHYIQTSSGQLNLRIGARFALADTADAHRALQGRKTTGKVVLLP
jgi:NADPH:quinone reductase